MIRPPYNPTIPMVKYLFRSLLPVILALVSSHASGQNPVIQSQSGFGFAVEVTDSIIAVGEPLNERFPGMTYVYERDAMSDWQLAASLKSSDGSIGDNFGTSLAAGDGRLFVGSTGSQERGGAVYAFAKDGSDQWVETAAIRPDGSLPGDQFGRAIAYKDGALFVSNQPYDRNPTVYVFSLDDSNWTQTSTIVPEESESNQATFGTAIAFDGNVLLIGSPREDGGRVHVYRLDDSGTWAHRESLSGTAVTSGRNAQPNAEAFGSKILLTDHQLFVTAPNADRYTGRVYSFTRSENGVFERSVNLSPFDARYGHSFARDLAFIGNQLWVSALTPNRMAGGIYVMQMTENGTDVIGSTKFYEPRVLPQTFFGESMDGAANVIAVGAYEDVIRSGAVYVYERDPVTGSWAPGQKLMAPSLSAYASVTGEKVECKDGDASGFGCERVDLVSFLTNSDLGLQPGIQTSDLWGWTDPETGKEYALVGSNDGTTVVDLSDPARPFTVGFLPKTNGTPATIWRDIKVYKDHAFIVADNAGHHGVQILDLRQLRDVTDPPVRFEETARYDGIHSAHNIVINEDTGFAYTVGNSQGGETCGGGSHIIDIREPTAPKFAGCFAHTGTGRMRTGYTHDAQCVLYNGPDERYTGREICFAANETAISIGDVTDKDSTRAIARGDYPNPGYTHQGWLSEDQRYFFVNDELDEINGGTDGTRTLIWDVAELDDPILVNEYVSSNKASDHNLYIRGNYMYQSNYVSGLRVVDVSNVEAPVEVGHFDTVPWGEDRPGFGGSWSNYPFFKSGLIVVTSGEEGLFVLKRSEVDS